MGIKKTSCRRQEARWSACAHTGFPVRMAGRRQASAAETPGGGSTYWILTDASPCQPHGTEFKGTLLAFINRIIPLHAVDVNPQISRSNKRHKSRRTAPKIASLGFRGLCKRLPNLEGDAPPPGIPTCSTADQRGCADFQAIYSVTSRIATSMAPSSGSSFAWCKP